ncbi:MAG: HAMP domain-containing histidine kinase [Planctomycetales bacterium]|nr:HAMP domain-containing histidine kinase [Planctomycetales bacterium]
MLSRWPMRNKFIVGIVLLICSVTVLFACGMSGVYAYRGLVRGIRQRAAELPIAVTLAQHASALEALVSNALNPEYTDLHSPLADHFLGIECREKLKHVKSKLEEYRDELTTSRDAADSISQVDNELAAADEMSLALSEIEGVLSDPGFNFRGEGDFFLQKQVRRVNELAAELPSFLQARMNDFATDVRVQYRTWIVLLCTTTLLAVSLMLLSIILLHGWVFRPLQQIIEGSRRVAGGDFNYRIQLKSADEMAELAGAMNDMTQRFQEIRDDLNNQVQQRTKEVVRSEQLASVGFLAAGVAHEINNPLASIALCAESLEDRVRELFPEEADAHDDSDDDGNGEATKCTEVTISEADIEVLRDYLQMIQDEAFRCKGITNGLLDFSRLSDVEKYETDLSDLVSAVTEMVRHVGTYRDKHVEFIDSGSVYVPVNAQEIKQVVLNLITNGLDSLDAGGKVSVQVRSDAANALLIVTDNGCGMTPEIQEHIFEPFFTRRRDGQGTGLGMSISYRIVADHGGDISVRSEGPGRGSQFIVRLPLQQPHSKANDRKHAA